MITCRSLSDPPSAGRVKICIRCNGDPQEARIYTVDAEGVEREIEGVIAASWTMASLSECTEATITVCESDVQLDTPASAVTRSGERVTRGVEVMQDVSAPTWCWSCYAGKCREHGAR